MGPKVEALCRFVKRTGGVGAIGAVVDTEAILAGTQRSSVCLQMLRPASDEGDGVPLLCYGWRCRAIRAVGHPAS